MAVSNPKQGDMNAPFYTKRETLPLGTADG